MPPTRYWRSPMVNPGVLRKWSIKRPGVATRMSTRLATFAFWQCSKVPKLWTIFLLTSTSSAASAAIEVWPTARPTERPTAGAIISNTAFTWHSHHEGFRIFQSSEAFHLVSAKSECLCPNPFTYFVPISLFFIPTIAVCPERIVQNLCKVWNSVFQFL